MPQLPLQEVVVALLGTPHLHARHPQAVGGGGAEVSASHVLRAGGAARPPSLPPAFNPSHALHWRRGRCMHACMQHPCTPRSRAQAPSVRMHATQSRQQADALASSACACVGVLCEVGGWATKGAHLHRLQCDGACGQVVRGDALVAHGRVAVRGDGGVGLHRGKATAAASCSGHATRALSQGEGEGEGCPQPCLAISQSLSD